MMAMIPDFDLVADGISLIKQRAQLLVNLGQSPKAQELILSAGLNNEQLADFRRSACRNRPA